MAKKIRIKSFSKPHLWYADKIGKVYAVESEGDDYFDVAKIREPKRVLKTDAEVVEVATIKIDGYRGFVKGDDILTEGSVHRVVEPPKGGLNGVTGYWVKGSSDEPILILHGEYEFEEYYVV